MEPTIQPLSQDDLAQVRGHSYAARALEVAAAGGHNIVLTGSPGVGKAMLARVLSTLLPAKDTTPLLYQPQPDDEAFCLPECGVLFLRDVHVWKVRDLTRLWQQRARQTEPVQLIATFEPCPCGYFGDPLVDCPCHALRIARHQKRIAPFLSDCIHIEVSAPKPEELRDTRRRESSSVVRQRVEQARVWQERRGMTNAALARLDRVQEAVVLDPVAMKLLNAAMRQLHLTPQALIEVLRVSRSIASLAEAEMVGAPHLAEAIQYRPRFH